MSGPLSSEESTTLLNLLHRSINPKSPPATHAALKRIVSEVESKTVEKKKKRRPRGALDEVVGLPEEKKRHAATSQNKQCFAKRQRREFTYEKHTASRCRASKAVKIAWQEHNEWKEHKSRVRSAQSYFEKGASYIHGLLAAEKASTPQERAQRLHGVGLSKARRDAIHYM